MKAVKLNTYGLPEALRIEEIEQPVPKPDEILIRVHSTAVNDYDWAMVRGKPYLYRLLFGVFKPRSAVPGMEMSGIIVSTGDNVTDYKVGDAVYGDTSEFGFGTYAEYVCVNQRAVIGKPAKMSFEEAASISHAAMLAMQGLFDHGKMTKGQKILINGAGGGVGTIGLQLCKLYDNEVTGVDTGPKLDMMRSIGFDHIVDYKKEDFTKNGLQYDLILDAKTNRSFIKYVRCLKPNGCYATVGGLLARLLQVLIMGPIVHLFTGKRLKMVALRPNKDLAYINQLYDEGKIKCVIDGPYPMEQVAEALRYFGEGKHKGKVILNPEQDQVNETRNSDT